jgi:uncharacterized protein (DUF305 family)
MAPPPVRSASHCRSRALRIFRFALPLVAALVLAMPALAAPMDPMDNPADTAFLNAMKGLMMGMHRNMPTGDTDHDFVRMMLPHHQAAVDMAKAELQYGQDAELKALATDIVAAQDKEITMMKAWLAKHAK